MQSCVWTAQGSLMCDNVVGKERFDQYEEEFEDGDYEYYVDEEGNEYEGFAVSAKSVSIPEGGSIKCKNDTGKAAGKVYRHTNGQYRHYPNSQIASSWNKDWNKNIMSVDCKGLKKGPDMPLFVRPANGASIKCKQDVGKFAGKVYRHVNGEYRHYPNAQVASSWNPNWNKNITTIDCSGLKQGTPLSKFQPPAEGASIKCTNVTGPAANTVYRYVDGQYRGYPSPQIASTWNKDWDKKIVGVDCSVLKKGAPLGAFKPPAEGSSIKCLHNKGNAAKAVYRYADGEYRPYPNPATAKSWNPNWDKNVTTVDCSALKKGAALGAYKPPAEGSSVKCKQDMNTKNTGKVYRYTNGQVRHYPNAAIAKSWNPEWNKTITTIDCTPLKVGKSMPPKKK